MVRLIRRIMPLFSFNLELRELSMNKIFRVVWSHAAQSWVAVSELASAKGKTKSKTISKLAALSLVAGTALSMDAMAASSTITAVSKTDGNLAILTNNQASINAQSTDATTPKNVIYIGNGRVPSAIGDEFVAIGNDMNGNSGGRAGDTLIGNRVRSGGGGQDSFATAVGYGAQVAGPSVAIGVGTSSDIGNAEGWKGIKYSGISIGAFSRVSGTADGGVAMGAISFADQTGSVAIGQLSGAASLLYDREVAGSGGGGKLYKTNEATGGNLVSIGAEAGARSTSSVAIGTQSTTSLGNDSIAMGTNSAAIKHNSIAIGHAAIAGGHTQADIDALDAKKMLLEADKANADKRLKEKTDAAEANPTAENKFQLSAAKAAVERLDLAIRRIDADLQRLSSVTTRDATNAIAIGNQSQATDESALAFGNTARAKGVASIAQGKNTQATAENAIAVGTSSNVSGANSVALGANITKLTTANSVVLGANSTEVVGTTGASHEVKEVTDATVRTIAGPNFTYSGFAGKPADAGHYVSIGQAGKERQIKNLAAGAVTPTSTDAINGSQLYALMDRVENKQEPVVYTNAAGDKLVKVGNDFYKTEDLDPATGKPLAGKTPVSAGDVIASMNNAGNNTTTPMALANIAGNLPGAKNGSTAPTTSGTLPEGADAPNTSNAATVGDVLNAGWNLTEKGVARDFVKPYDTVDFIDGNGTSVTVTTDAGNKVSHIKYDVKAADDSITVGNGGIKVNTGGITPVTKDDGDKKSGQVIPNKGDENKVASVGDVANAINSAFWKVTGAKDGGEFAEGNATTEEAVKAGDKVTFKAGENIKLKQAGKDFTYSLNPVLSNITSIGGNGTTMTFKPEGVDLGGKKITNIAPGTDGTDAVNKSQLDAAVNGMATKPLSFSGDNKEAGKFDRTLGTEVKVVGGADASKLSDNNIGVIGDKTDTLTVKLAKSLKGLSDVEVKDDAGNTTNITPNGITISQPAKDGKKPDNVSLTKDGLNNGGQNITNVAGNLPGAKKDTTAPTTASEGPSATDLPNITNNAATVGDVLNAGWNLQNNGEAKDFVKPYDTVNFIDGEGTTAVVTTTDNKVSTVKYDVKLGAGLKKDDKGNITVDAGNITNENGAPKVADADKDKVATAGNVADAINNSYWTASAEKDGKVIGKDDNIKPSGKVTFDAGKNIEIDHSTPNKFTFKTVDNPEFKTLDLNDGAGNKVNLAPTADGLKLGKGDKNEPANITNVTSGLKPYGDAKPDAKDLVNLDTPNVSDNTAATVGDLRNMGWVVGTPENGYVDTVKNANKVDFKAGAGVSVTGETKDGVREITIAVKDGEVVKPNEFTAKVNGKDTPVTKVGDQYYNTVDIDPKTGKPNAKANPVTLDVGTTPTNSGDGYVTGNKVATAIQKSGFVVGKQTEKLSAADFKDEDEKVNPDDELRFADGNNTKVKLATKESVDKDGNKVTTTTVKVDVTGLPVQYTDKNGTPVTKVGDKYFTVDEKGNPTTTEVKPADLTTNMVNPAAAPNKIGAPMALGNVKSNLPETKNGNNPTLNQAAPTDEDADKVKNNAATVSDVLNAGWNLQNNGEAKDFVKPYDTVNFVDGKGTKAVVETTPNATTSNVKFDIDTGKITNNADGSVQGSVTPEMKKALDDAKKALADATTPEAKKAAQDKVDAAQANINNAGNQIATAQGVADAINKSGFTLTTSENGGKKLSGKDELINPGKKVDLAAGKNMTVKQDPEGKVTYATADEVNFSSVQFGDNGPKITNNGGNINVGTATGAPTKITGVAPGEISSTSTDAINGSQLHSVASDINNRIGSLDNKIDMADKNLRGGVAQAIAAAGLVQAYLPGKSLLAIGGGVYRGEAGYAIGYSSISDNGNWIIKGTASGNSRGHFGASTSVGYQW
ncbi:Hep/Hag repeat protein [Neisseria cinerea ATCC 14685]|uniref:Hep/Hag repeat protein n=2 Tax=Neisseria cinerea TaxID=483 RepID=D0W4H9_NEICI|nr:Hep/Hag repeat protein [Neisseria cinerea ATCC 14685]